MGQSYKSLAERQKRAIERALVMDQGYVLDFSNRTIKSFFEDHFRIEFYAEKYAANGDSKAKRLRCVFTLEGDGLVANILEKLWHHRSSLPDYYKLGEPDAEERLETEFQSAVRSIRGERYEPVVLEALERFDGSNTLDNLLNSIERDVRDDRSSAALDRLHTYCQRRFRVLLEASGRQVRDEEPLHSRVGAYAKVLESQGVSETSLAIIRSSISIFEKFNAARNNQSLAHDNELLNAKEARFVLDSIGVVLKFLKSLKGD